MYNFFMSEYIKPRTVFVGGKNNVKKVGLGGNEPVSIQTMWKESIKDVYKDSKKLSEIIKRIQNLKALGCDILRFAVPDSESAKSLSIIQENVSIPLVADIHFDYKLALECLKGNVIALRINPGNIGSRDRVLKVVDACKEKDATIRIGVNSGSLPKDLFALVQENKMSRSDALVETARREVEVFDQLNFSKVVVSIKASSVKETNLSNQAFAKKFDIPLHIGVTEAGPLISGVVKSSIAFSSLLTRGIGSTVRVSLSSSMENEVIAAREILSACSLRKEGISIISCPRCGREGFDVHGFVQRWQEKLYSIEKKLTVAIMGCIVNGPGEGKTADIGIAGAGDKAIIFKKGKISRTVDAKDADKVFEEELNSLLNS